MPLRRLDSSGGKRVVLEVEVRNYPEHAARQNPKLRLERRKLTLAVSLRGPGGEETSSTGVGFAVAIVPVE